MAATFDGQFMRLYINGTLDRQMEASSERLKIWDRPEYKLVIGNASLKSRMAWTDKYFDGLIDEVRIWRRSLSDREVSGLYQSSDLRAKSPNQPDRSVRDGKPVQPAETIAWGKPRDGVRLGLSRKAKEIAENTKFVEVDVWFENVGKEPKQVPMHNDRDVNTSVLMFGGQYDGEPFYVSYHMERLATAPPKYKQLEPGCRYHERFTLAVAKRGSQLGYAGLPALAAGKTLTLQVGWCDRNDPHTEKDWQSNKTLKSGSIHILTANK
jgi:hypothetical protein